MEFPKPIFIQKEEFLALQIAHGDYPITNDIFYMDKIKKLIEKIDRA